MTWHRESSSLKRLARGLTVLSVIVFAAPLPTFCRDQDRPASPLAALPEQPDPQQSPSSPPAGDNGSNQGQSGQNQEENNAGKKDDRMFFVMPNFLTVENEAKVQPLKWKQKFAIAARGSFDPYEFVTAGILAGIRQAENSYPAFGQGAAGYAKRYGSAFADQVDGNMMVGAVFPSILRTDPRYFQLGHGGFMHRFGYAISRIFVTRKDSAGQTFNFAEPCGNATAIAISTLYYPSQDRGLSSGLNGWGIQMAIDAFGNELKEFWPDIHHAIVRRKHPAPAAD
jgi:hypothetical protein